MTDTTPIQVTVNYTPVLVSVGRGDDVLTVIPKTTDLNYALLRDEARRIMASEPTLVTRDNAPRLSEFSVKALTQITELYTRNVWGFDPAKLAVCKATPRVVHWKSNEDDGIDTAHYHLCLLCCLNEPAAMEFKDAIDKTKPQPGDLSFKHPRQEQAAHIPKEIVGKYYNTMFIHTTEGLVCVYPPYLKPIMHDSLDTTQLYLHLGITFVLKEQA